MKRKIFGLIYITSSNSPLTFLQFQKIIHFKTKLKHKPNEAWYFVQNWELQCVTPSLIICFPIMIQMSVESLWITGTWCDRLQHQEARASGSLCRNQQAHQEGWFAHSVPELRRVPVVLFTEPLFLIEGLRGRQEGKQRYSVMTPPIRNPLGWLVVQTKALHVLFHPHHDRLHWTRTDEVPAGTRTLHAIPETMGSGLSWGAIAESVLNRLG